uniref:Uncharacterized protein n=1 Tax=Rhizophora mucronata TaxID=61149 RepID=A0A2P2NRB7_RHIMU
MQTLLLNTNFLTKHKPCEIWTIINPFGEEKNLNLSMVNPPTYNPLG